MYTCTYHYKKPCIRDVQYLSGTSQPPTITASSSSCVLGFRLRHCLGSLGTRTKMLFLICSSIGRRNVCNPHLQMVSLKLRIRLNTEKKTKINVSKDDGSSKSKMSISLQGDLQEKTFISETKDVTINYNISIKVVGYRCWWTIWQKRQQVSTELLWCFSFQDT